MNSSIIQIPDDLSTSYPTLQEGLPPDLDLPVNSSRSDTLSPLERQTKSNPIDPGTSFGILWRLAFSIANLVIDIIFIIMSCTSWRGEAIFGSYLFSMLASRIVNVILCRYYICTFSLDIDSIRKVSFVIVSALDIKLAKSIINSSKPSESVGALCLFLDESYVRNVDQGHLAISTFELVEKLLADLPQMILSIVGITRGSSITVISIICLIFKLSDLSSYVLSFFKSPSFKPIARALLTRLSE